jgi:hypothetical protein
VEYLSRETANSTAELHKRQRGGRGGTSGSRMGNQALGPEDQAVTP